jgi:adhesin transport system outer membrane protein
MNKIRLLGMAAVTFGVLFAVGSSLGETLQEAVKNTIETNPEIRAVAFNRLATDQVVKQARAGYFPELGVNAWAGVREYDEPFDENLNPWEFTLGIRQNIFRGFQDVNEVDRTRANARSQGYLVQSVSENTALQVASVYLGVMRKQDFVNLAEENLKLHLRIADQIKLRSESGIDRKADMNQVESRLALAQSNLIVTETNLVDAETSYMAVVGNLPEDLVKPKVLADVIPQTLEETQYKAGEQHPTLKMAEEDLIERQAQEEVAEAPYWPIVDLELDKKWYDELEAGLNTDTEELTAIVRVRYNFFRGWKDRARKVETTYLVSEAREVRNNAHRQLIELVRLAWMAKKVAEDRARYLEDRVKSSEETSQAYSKQWDIGKRTLLDVLDAEAERIDAKKEQINNNFDGLYANYRLLNSMGVMVHTLELQWPEEAYVEGEGEENGELCSDSIDNDEDGLIDCDDPGCSSSKQCK